MHTLRVTSRPAGKAGKLRRDGFVPGVVYGPSIDSTPVSISQKDLRTLFGQITRSSRIELELEDGGDTKTMDVFQGLYKSVPNYKAIVKSGAHYGAALGQNILSQRCENTARRTVLANCLVQMPGCQNRQWPSPTSLWCILVPQCLRGIYGASLPA